MILFIFFGSVVYLINFTCPVFILILLVTLGVHLCMLWKFSIIDLILHGGQFLSGHVQSASGDWIRNASLIPAEFKMHAFQFISFRFLFRMAPSWCLLYEDTSI